MLFWCPTIHSSRTFRHGSNQFLGSDFVPYVLRFEMGALSAPVPVLVGVDPTHRRFRLSSPMKVRCLENVRVPRVSTARGVRAEARAGLYFPLRWANRVFVAGVRVQSRTQKVWHGSRFSSVTGRIGRRARLVALRASDVDQPLSTEKPLIA